MVLAVTASQSGQAELSGDGLGKAGRFSGLKMTQRKVEKCFVRSGEP